MNFVDTLKAEWGVIVDAPISIIIIATFTIVAAYKVFDFLHKAKVDTIERELSLSKATVDEFKRKTDVDSPDDAKHKIDALERKITEIEVSVKKMEPMRLSQQQKSAMISALSIAAGNKVSIAKDGASPDAAKLSADLVDAFKRGGWSVSTPMVLGLGNPPPSGIEIGFSQLESRSVAEQAIINAFESANISYDLRSRRIEASEGTPIIAEITLTTSSL